MAKQPEQLEQELKTIWQRAPNTRKRSAPRRVEAIIESSRAELSLRDLLIFCIHLAEAFFMLLGAVVQALFVAPKRPTPPESQESGK